MPEPEDGLSPLAKSMRQAGPWLEVTSRLTGGALFGVLAGWGLDKAMGWDEQHWGIIICSALGLFAGFWGFISGVIKMGKKK